MEDGISLCMVVRNAESHLADLLPRMEPLVDEILIVDQSSTDGTVKVAKKHGARIIPTTPKGYADPDRDYCYSLATHDWILAMDPDERLDAFLTANLREMVKEQNVDVFWFLFDNTINGVDMAPLLGPDPHPRLWRKLNADGEPMLRWPARAHTPPAIATERVCFVEGGGEGQGVFIHARTWDEVKESHGSRTPVIDPQMQQVEQEFLTKVEAILKAAGKPVGEKGEKPGEVDMTKKTVGRAP